MFRRAWKPILGVAAVVGAPTYLYYRYSSSRAKPRPPDIFDLPVKVKRADGKSVVEHRTMPLISKEEVDARLNEHAQAFSEARPGGIVWKYSTAHVAANDPIEDANVSRIVERDPSEHSPPGDFLFFAVMDGHGGPYTSRLLSMVLLPAIGLELASLTKEPNTIIPKTSVLQDWKSIFRSTTAAPIPFDADPTYVSLAIQTAFANLDSEIVNAPLRLIAESVSKEGANQKGIPDLSQHPMALPTMSPALSGSCALLALFDTAHRNLYVACTGDSRAVAGIWEESEDGKGHWRVDVLSEDQTGRNPSEIKRIQSEHPAEETDTVIMRGRVLGGLEPTRAFGDARYKWSRDVQDLLSVAFMKGNKSSMRAAPAMSKTPPYVTPRPVITHRKLDFLPLPDRDPSSTKTKSKSALRFLVLATDGLWDQLTSEDVVALVGGYLQGIKGVVPKSTLSTLVPTVPGNTVEGKDKKRHNTKGSWAFVDDNLSTHLIRNAFGGGNEAELRQYLSIPAGLARSYRDDVTCTVVYWEDGRESEAKSVTISPPNPEQEKLKAKL